MATVQQKINVAYNEAFKRNATAGELSYYGDKGDVGYNQLIGNLRKDTNAGGNFATWRQQQSGAPTPIASPGGGTSSTEAKKATLYGANGQVEVVSVGSKRASQLQSMGWGLTKGSFNASKNITGGTSEIQKVTLYGPNGQKKVVNAGSNDARYYQSKGWGLTEGSYTAPRRATLYNEKTGHRQAVIIGSATEKELFKQGYKLDTGQKKTEKEPATTTDDIRKDLDEASGGDSEKAEDILSKMKSGEINDPGEYITGEKGPQAPDLMATYVDMRTKHNVADTEQNLINLDAQLDQLDDSYQAGLNKVEDQFAPMEVLGGRAKELGQQYTEQRNTIQRQRDYMADKLNMANATIQMMMGLTQQEFDNARAVYNDKFDQKLATMNYLSGEAQREYDISRDKKNDATANIATITDMMTESGKTWNDLTSEMQSHITNLEASSGMPVGSIKEFIRANPEASLLGTKDGVDEYGNDIMTFIYADENGNPGMIKTIKTGGYTAPKAPTNASGMTAAEQSAFDAEIDKNYELVMRGRLEEGDLPQDIRADVMTKVEWMSNSSPTFKSVRTFMGKLQGGSDVGSREELIDEILNNYYTPYERSVNSAQRKEVEDIVYEYIPDDIESKYRAENDSGNNFTIKER